MLALGKLLLSTMLESESDNLHEWRAEGEGHTVAEWNGV